MFAFFIRRLVTLVPTLVFVSMLIFGLQQLLPGDPALIMAGEERDPKVLEEIRELDAREQAQQIEWAFEDAAEEQGIEPWELALQLIAESPEQLQAMLDCLGRFCAATLLTVNVAKSEVVVFNSCYERATQKGYNWQMGEAALRRLLEAGHGTAPWRESGTGRRCRPTGSAGRSRGSSR